jgi:phospholipid-binding lipoprotein MlaA
MRNTDTLFRFALLALLAAPAVVVAQDAPAGPTPPAQIEPAAGAAAADEEEFFVFDESEDGSAPPVTIADPLENYNRAMFAFNDKAYRIVLKPIARGLRVLPEPVRVSGRNFFTNLGAPVSAASALLQGDVRNFGTELGRFLLNTTAGLAGLFDVATEVGIVQDEEDLGQTLARYGVGHGFYLVMPFYGSSSLRDVIGNAGTAAINPVYQNLDTGEIIAINVVEAEIALSLDRDTYESLYDSSLDPYAFFRSAWTQNRAGRVAE